MVLPSGRSRRIETLCSWLRTLTIGIVPITEGLVRARGVRYATASRFAAPEPYKWDGVIEAGERGPACPQPPSSLAALVGSSVDGLTFDEHCQVLSVTA